MEKYILHMRHDVLNRVTVCMSAHIENDKWFTVEVLGDLIGVDLSCIFGNGNLGWSPTVLLYHCQVTDTTVYAALSVPKPEELPIHRVGRTVRDRMEYLAGLERPTLKDWLNNSGIHNHSLIVTGSEKYGKRRDDRIDSISYPHKVMLEHPEYVAGMETVIRKLMEVKKDVPFVKELLNGLYGVNSLRFTENSGEQCRDAAVSESAEDVRKTTRLDGVDAFTYAIRALFERKDAPGFKNALDGIYGTARDVASIDLEQMYPKKLENVKADEPNALFVTIEIDTFEATPESVEAVNSFISNAGEGRDIHLRII